MLIGVRVHLFPSRTQKLSSFPPTIVAGRLAVKIGNANIYNSPLNRVGCFYVRQKVLRLFAGSDILSDKEGLVIFDNKSYITDRVMFDSTTGKVTLLTGVPVSQDYLDRKLLEVKQKIALSKGILDNDYYSYLP